MASDDDPKRLPSVLQAGHARPKSVWRRGLEVVIVVCALLIVGTAVLLAIKYLLMIFAQVIAFLVVIALLLPGSARRQRDR